MTGALRLHVIFPRPPVITGGLTDETPTRGYGAGASRLGKKIVQCKGRLPDGGCTPLWFPAAVSLAPLHNKKGRLAEADAPEARKFDKLTRTSIASTLSH
jgi:hypothetical protein